MRAVVYRGVNDLRLETVPVPRIGPNELLVQVAVCGVCPTDIKKIHYGTVPPPRIFGHETAGTIVKIGSQKPEIRSQKSGGNDQKSKFGAKSSTFNLQPSTFGLRVGDRVALHHHVPCLDCHYCRHRAFAQCATYKRTGITAGFEPAGGGYAEYVRVLPFVLPGVVKIPAKNSFEEGAMLEPVNTVLKAVKRLELLRGDAVLVVGQGPIGLMFTRLLQLAGMRVLATDLLPSRLKLAKQFGAERAVLASQLSVNFSSLSASGGEGRGEVARAAKVSSLVPRLSSPLDAAVIAVPSDAAVHQALQLVRGAGKVLLFAHTKRAEVRSQKSGLPPSAFNLDLASICLDEKDLIGSYSSDFTLQREVARLVFSRQLDIRPLVTHRFTLEQTADAIALAARPTEGSLKIIVKVS
jgi:L-iditol 2-dehydrogenase